MNANESPYPVPKAVLDPVINTLRETDFNFYPDTDSTELRRGIGKFLDFPPDQILVGNGSDEMIDVLIKTFVSAGDAVVSHDPTFTMYQIFTEIIGAEYYGVSADSRKQEDPFSINIPALIKKANTLGAKAVFLCTPNNPTGKTLSKDQVLRVLQETRGMVVIDEAYREFSDQDFLPLLKQGHPRLLILRTFSKANGLAGVRGGYLLGSPETVSALHKVKPPYNVNLFTQKMLTSYISYLQTPEGRSLIQGRISEIRRERDRLYQVLQELPGVTPYASEGNFIPFRVTAKKQEETSGEESFDKTLDQRLLEEGFHIRKFYHQSIPYYRISMGTPEENRQLIETLQQTYYTRRGFHAKRNH